MNIFSVVLARKTLEAIADRAVDIRVAYKVAKFFKQTDNDAEFYAEKNREIVNKYAVASDNGLIVPTERIAEYQKELTEMQNIKIDDEPTIRFTLDDLGGLGLSVKQVYSLQDFIEDNE